jgi:hypothetical protein
MSARDLPPGLTACRKVIGGECDPFAAVWRDMPEAERAFWLSASRRSTHYAKADAWASVPGEVRCTIKANLYRAANRASVLLAAGAGQ